MKNKHILGITTVLAIAVIIPALVQAHLTTGGQNTGGADTTLTTSGQNTGGADSALTTSGQNIGGADSALTTSGQNTGGADTTDVTPVIIPSSTSGGTSYSSGGSSSSGRSNIMIAGCPIVTTVMKIGANNNSDEVTKLQSFLKSSENANVDVTGIYDEKTENAVRAFQTKYTSVVLAPWGIVMPTGVVSLTTGKKLNELACRIPLTLSATELSYINSYKQGSEIGSGTTVGVDLSDQNANAVIAGPEVGVTGDTNENTAAVANTSIFGRFWNFLKSLFK